MSVRIICPSCRSIYEVPDKQIGQKFKCEDCGEPLVAAARSDGISGRSRRAPRQEEDDERPRPTCRRTDHDDDDEPRQSPRRRKAKGGGIVLPIVAASLALLVIVIAGAVVTYLVFLKEDSAPHAGGGPGPGPGPAGLPPGMNESALMERQADLEIHFRAPEEPPVSAMTFREPPPAEAVAPEPVANAAGQLTPAVLRRIKECTVYIRVQTAQGGMEGSGFFGSEPGFVVTNAHVVGMLNRQAPPPQNIKVIRNKGEKNEVSLVAQVVAVDPDVDLALLSVPKADLPPSLVVKSALALLETQPIYVAGFPLGELPGKNVTINEYKMSSLKKEKGELDKLQIAGDMQPGNSGGPVLDAGGDVVGVCVSILRDRRTNTDLRINFAIPADKVIRFLEGRFAGLTLGSPTRADVGLRVPVSVRLIDPLGRVSRVALDFWAGKPGAERPPGRKSPEAQPGDGPRQTLTLEVHQETGTGDLVLPPLPQGQVCWVQPVLLGRGGSRVWLSAHVYRPSPPVEPKPARLAWQAPGERRFVLERWSAVNYTDPQSKDRHGVLTTEVHFTDAPRGAAGADVNMHRQYTGFKEGVLFDDKAWMTRRLQYIPAHLALLADNFVLGGQGTTLRGEIDPRMKDAAPAAKPYMLAFEQDVQRYLQALEVPLPGKELRPGETWTFRRPRPVEGTWKELGVLPAALWAAAESEVLDLTYTYEGLRTVNGTAQAVVRIRGQADEPEGRAAAAGPALTGTAVIDPATGQVVEEEVVMPISAELSAFNTVVVRAQGTALARLRRE
jgi:S1-C subfamily serine protease